MSAAVQAAEASILLLGNPNTGKSSIFSALTGARQRVANFPGVTVEAKVGPWRLASGTATLVDLPGCYSLAARSPDERIAADALTGHLPGVPPPDAVVLVVDASCVERNLYLATQVLEHDVPVVVALTMGDVAGGRGIAIDAGGLSDQLGVPVVSVHVPSGAGLEPLGQAVASVLGRRREPLHLDFPAPVREAAEGMAAEGPGLASFPVALRVLVDGPDRAPAASLAQARAGAARRIEALRAGLGGSPALALAEAETRYRAIRRMVEKAKRQDAPARPSLTDRVDAVLTHKVWGLLVLTAILAFVFQAIYSWSAPAMDVIEGAFGAVGSWVAPRIPEGALRGLVVDGVIAGVGGVLVFLPQILVLFFFIAMLEDIGYMSRAAFLMDRLMARLGLSGRSFIPLLSSFACAIPGIMGARVIEDRRSRLTTIFLAPFMSCSARLPVYALMIGAFVPSRRLGGVVEFQGLVLLGMYVLGIAVAVPTALLVRRVAFQAEPTSFLLELPSYKMPQARNVAMMLWHRAGSFVTRAGTMILTVTVLVWALGYFPRSEEVLAAHAAQRTEAERQHRERVEALRAAPGEQRDAELRADAERQAALDAIDHAEAGELLRRSALGTLGRVVEPLVAPLGWDWRIGMAVIASFPAREVVIGTLGTIFNLGQADEESEPLKEVLRDARRTDGTPLFTLATAMSLMVFFALCMQCAATLAIMKKETNSWRWPAASFAYMTALAYVGALLAYQITATVAAGA